MYKRFWLRRLIVVALLGGSVGVVVQPPMASASATGSATTAGFCWNKPILPDWCVFERPDR